MGDNSMVRQKYTSVGEISSIVTVRLLLFFLRGIKLKIIEKLKECNHLCMHHYKSKLYQYYYITLQIDSDDYCCEKFLKKKFSDS